MRAIFTGRAPELIQKALDLALAGDQAMLRLCIERIVPGLRAADAPISIAIARGALIDQGQAKVLETDELARPVAASEKAHGSLRDRIRRLEDRSTNVPTAGINPARAELIRCIIRGELAYDAMTPAERQPFDNYLPLGKSVFDVPAAELAAKIRGGVSW